MCVGGGGGGGGGLKVLVYFLFEKKCSMTKQSEKMQLHAFFLFINKTKSHAFKYFQNIAKMDNFNILSKFSEWERGGGGGGKGNAMPPYALVVSPLR